jgi:hypothetical protein
LGFAGQHGLMVVAHNGPEQEEIIAGRRHISQRGKAFSRQYQSP